MINASPRRDLRLIRLYFFTWLGGSAFLSPFISLFYLEKGLNGTEIGLLGTIWAVAGLAAAPLWGRWSDHTTRPRQLIQVALLGSAACMLLLSQQSIFWIMAVVIGTDALIASGVDSISSLQAISVTQGSEKAGFGSVRLWGSLGWALLAPVAGWLIERTSLLSAFLGYAVFMIASVAALAFIRTGASSAPKGSTGPHPDLGHILKALLRDRSLVGMALATIILVLSMSGTYRFEAIYLRQLGAQESIIGLANTVGALIELPAMLWADRLVHRYGAGRVLMTAFLLHAGSMVFVLAHPAVITIFIMRFLHGVAYSLYLVAFTKFIIEHTPGLQQAMVLAIYSVTLPGLIQILAGPLSGLIFDTIGAYWLYACALVGNLICWLTMYLSTKPTRLAILKI